MLYKVLEYETHLNLNLGGPVKLTDGQAPVVAIHPKRVTEGNLTKPITHYGM